MWSGLFWTSMLNVLILIYIPSKVCLWHIFFTHFQMEFRAQTFQTSLFYDKNKRKTICSAQNIICWVKINFKIQLKCSTVELTFQPFLPSMETDVIGKSLLWRHGEFPMTSLREFRGIPREFRQDSGCSSAILRNFSPLKEQRPHDNVQGFIKEVDIGK